MKQSATVVLVDGKLMAQIVRSEACAQCGACRYGQKENMLVPLPKGDFALGDMVELELSERAFSAASLLAYAFPLALMFAGLFVASRATKNEVVMALSALAMLGVGLALIRLIEPKLKRSGRFAPIARKCEPTKTNGIETGGKENDKDDSTDGI